MTFKCKGVCHRHHAHSPGIFHRYSQNTKRCTVCSIYIKWEGQRCPCCSNLLKTRPRKTEFKIKCKARLENDLCQ